MSPHFLLVTYPIQSHINPALEFAKRLLRVSASVTLAVTLSAYRRLEKATLPDGIAIAAISDGYDDGYDKNNDAHINDYMSMFELHGSITLTKVIEDSAKEGKPVTFVVHTLLLPWAGKVARGFDLPSALLWIQPAVVLDIYYYYFHGYKDAIATGSEEEVEFPGLPFRFKARDIPSFLLPANPYTFALPAMDEQFQDLDSQTKPMILVNTFDALEPDALKAIEKLNLIAVGPLLPSAFLEGGDPSDNSFGVDLFKRSKEYLSWLNAQREASVVYVSFGSISVLHRAQMEEIARGLLESGRPFLWVVRKEEGKEEIELSCAEELEEKGLIVPWCSQVEVLSHAAVGCFVTHCGWNSSLESVAAGVPMVAFPQWTDQTTNAKMIEDLWRTGVRVNENQEGLVERGEIKRCLEIVMESEEMRMNAHKWRELAIGAAREGGSSHKNLRDFVKELSGRQGYDYL